jgi:L-2,4-diaminobutyrate transaminase
MESGTSQSGSLEDLDRATVFHPATDLKAHASGALGTPRIIESGEGIYITDSSGRQLLDGFAGLYCVNVGYGRRSIADAIYGQAKKLAYYHAYAGHSNEPLIRLSKRIIDMAPAGMSRVYYGTSGSDANETQMKLAWYYHSVRGNPEKRKILSRRRAYHGSGVITGSLTGLSLFQQHFNLPLDIVKHTITPHYWKEAPAGMSEQEFSAHCASELERLILTEDPDTIAAFIGEPVLGTGGIIPPPEGYWDAIQPVLKKYDILLIADEVITGFGRIGYDFGCERYGIEPDLISCAKGLTSGYAPLSAVIVGEKVWNVLEEGAERFGPIGHGWTYSAHALGTAAALANLDILEQEDLAGNARDTGDYFLARLHESFDEHPHVGEVRGVGLLAALEFVADRESRRTFDPTDKVAIRIAAACLDEGLVARAMPQSDTLGFAPPLIVTRNDIDTIVTKTEAAVDRVTAELAS